MRVLNKVSCVNQYEVILEVCSQSVTPRMILRQDGEIIGYNEAMAKLTGYSHQEVPNLHVWMLKLYPNRKYRDRVIMINQLLPNQEVDSEGDIYAITIMTRKDGQQRYIKLFDQTISYNGEVTDLRLVHAEDVTDYKQAMESSRSSRERCERIINSVSDGIIITDLNGVIIHLNKTACHLYGFGTNNEFIGLSAFELFDDKYRQRANQHIQRALGQGRVDDITCRFRRSDGSNFIGELGVSLLRDAYGCLDGIIMVVRDITERKQIEQSLKESEEFNSNLLLNSPIPIIVINPDTSVRYVNPAFEHMTGFTSTELLGIRHPFPWLTDGDSDQSRKDFKKAMQKGGCRQEQVFIKKTGERFWVETTSVPVKKEGQPIYYLVSWVAIDEHKRLRENMQFYISEITRAREEECKRIAHELHDDTIQTLSAVGIDIQSLVEYEKVSPSARDQLNQIRLAIGRVVNELRHLSQQLRPTLIEELGMMSALRTLINELSSKGKLCCRLEMFGSEQKLPSEMELILFRILQEGLRNIEKHSAATECAANIIFTSELVTLEIIDNGIGFSVPQLPCDLVREGKLGLAGILERTRLLNGTLEIESEPSKGTTIRAKFPQNGGRRVMPFDTS